MVVMLIMSIILAAMAPVMTTRSKADSSSPWRYSPENLSDAYFGPGESQVAMIGQPNKLETDDAARLILTTSSSLPVHLSFKRDNTTVGRLQFVDTNLVLGSGSMDHLNGGGNNISIGPNNLTQVTSGGSNIAIGDNAMLSTTSGGNNIGIGTTLTGNIDGSNNVAVGDDSLTRANSSWNTVVGRNAYQLGTGGSNTIIGGDAMSEGSGQNNVAVGTNALWYGNGDGNVAIGANSNYKNQTLTNFTNSTAVGFSSYAIGTGSVALGASSNAEGENSISLGLSSSASETDTISIGNSSSVSAAYSVAIGGSSTTTGENSIAIGQSSSTLSNFSTSIGYDSSASGNSSNSLGYYSKASGSHSLSLGSNSEASGSYTTALGHTSKAGGLSSTSLGVGAVSTGQNSNAIGGYSNASGMNSISIGYGAQAKGNYNIAIGSNACQYATGSNVVCIGSDSGPTYDMDQSKDHMVYLGTSSDTVYIPGNLIVGKDTLLGARAVNDGHTYAVYLKAHNKDQWSDWVYLGTDDYKGGDDNFYRTNPITVGPFTLGPSDKFSSDRRLKYVGKEFTSGLDKIRQLKVFNYTFKKDKTKTPHVGVIAQDLQKVFPDAVKKGKDGFLTIRFEDMFYAMINAIKELDTRITALEKENQELKVRLEKLEAKISY